MTRPRCKVDHHISATTVVRDKLSHVCYLRHWLSWLLDISQPSNLTCQYSSPNAPFVDRQVVPSCAADHISMLDSLLTWTAHSEHQEVWAGPSWSSFALKVRSSLLPGLQDPYKIRSVTSTRHLMFDQSLTTPQLPIRD
jgi:hypothetical protein